MTRRLVIVAPGMLALVGLLCACGPMTRMWKGKVVEVRAGDTLTVLQGRRQVLVRLHGVGTPGVRRPAGKSARRMISRLVLGRQVKVREVRRDRRGRCYGEVRLGTLGLRELLLYTGLGWQIVQYDDSPALRSLEREARRARRGIWAGM